MKAKVVIQIVYSQSVEQVWKAITDKEAMKIWYFDIPDFQAEPGCSFDFYEPGGKNEFHHFAVVQQVIPYKKLMHSWTHPSHSKGISILTWELEQKEQGTLLTLIHEGLENFADGGEAFLPVNYEKGWHEILHKSLKSYLNNI
ncbi:SRPBCC family protein [Sphingobacterium spiritivorum]|uniref:SRPBCC family protein n=1 Tax=Sphingobacterium spiritivorum TaxID=258 RepID=UPI003DA3969F